MLSILLVKATACKNGVAELLQNVCWHLWYVTSWAGASFRCSQTGSAPAEVPGRASPAEDPPQVCRRERQLLLLLFFHSLVHLHPDEQRFTVQTIAARACTLEAFHHASGTESPEASSDALGIVFTANMRFNLRSLCDQHNKQQRRR